MCGIAGFQSAKDDPYISASLARSLEHRGPDGTWCTTHGGYTVVQTRLAVIDLSDRVAYPIPNESEDTWLLFNGEIYDYVEARHALERRGHRFRTNCDAEVVVHAFEEWDLGAFSRLNGMFAVALVDEQRGRLVLARDRFGIKPLVRTTGELFAFSSDAMALVAAGLSAGTVDRASLAEYLAFHYIPPPLTGIADVRDVEPGTALVREADGSISVTRWSQPVFPDARQSRNADVDDVDTALRTAVRRQLVSDVDVGLMLSSGLDSALLLAYSLEAGAKPRTFTIAFPGHGDYDESAGAASLARAYGVPNEVISFEVGFAEAVEGVARAFDKPFADSSAIAMLQLARTARSSVKVALSGTGGDELFAGYYRLRAHRLRPLLALAATRSRRHVGSEGAERRNLLRLSRGYLERLRAADHSTAVRQYLSIVGSATSSAALGLLESVDLESTRAAVAHRHHLSDGDASTALSRLQEFELRTYLPGDVLMKDDRATMGVGLEARVPFLDEALVQIASRLPDKSRASVFNGKRVLRELAQRKLPRDVSSRKRGFAVPLAALLSAPWSKEAAEWIGAQESELVDPTRFSAQLSANRLHAADVWALSALVAWEARLRRARAAAGGEPVGGVADRHG